MNVVLVIVRDIWLDYSNRYRVYPDTPDGRFDALVWAKENGYANEFPVNWLPGRLNVYQCGDVDVGIMVTGVQNVLRHLDTSSESECHA